MVSGGFDVNATFMVGFEGRADYLFCVLPGCLSVGDVIIRDGWPGRCSRCSMGRRDRLAPGGWDSALGPGSVEKGEEGGMAGGRKASHAAPSADQKDIVLRSIDFPEKLYFLEKGQSRQY